MSSAVEISPGFNPCEGSAIGALLCAIAEAALSCLTDIHGGSCTWKTLMQEFLDPFDLWFSSAFTGRAKAGKDSATDDVALFLIASANPIVQSWGAAIRIYEAIGGCYLSGAGPCATAFKKANSAFVTDMGKQWAFNGPGYGITMAQNYGKLAALKNPDSNTGAINSRKILDNIYLAAVEKGQIDPSTGFPPLATKPPVCPTGQVLVNDKCQPIPKQQCPPGQINLNGTCVLIPTSATCPAGEVLNIETGLCFVPTPTSCPVGFTKDQSGKCVPSTILKPEKPCGCQTQAIAWG
jgi:hypothetical protein